MIIITGPTATGKTRLAAELAVDINGEVISADSRQVYKLMNIGTGKDYNDYLVNGFNVPYHLIDIAEAGTEYNVFRFQKDFINAYQDIKQRNKIPVLCGGTGLYVDAVASNYNLIEVPEDLALREELKDKAIDELRDIVSKHRKVHNTTDLNDRERLIRAIEIDLYRINNKQKAVEGLEGLNYKLFGVYFERSVIRQRISERLKQRIGEGMIDEIKLLLNKGIAPETLIKYGLEYKYVTQYVIGSIDYNEMYRLLEIAIHQFAKRQMSWFRRMEKNGTKINWIDGNLPNTEKIKTIKKEYFN